MERLEFSPIRREGLMKRVIVTYSLFVMGVLVGSVSSEMIRAQGSQYETKKIQQTVSGTGSVDL
jgi:hypothetical protein